LEVARLGDGRSKSGLRLHLESGVGIPGVEFRAWPNAMALVMDTGL
jgi:hypothetical protein